VADVQRVPGPRVVHVEAGVVVDGPVVAEVVDPAERQVGALVVALGGVVVDDVEDDLEAGRVEVGDHRLELVDLLAVRAARGVVGVGGEEPDGVVAPVVPEPLLLQEVVLDEVVDRLELDRGHAELDEVVDDRRRGQARVGAAQLGLDARVLHGEALHVGLVDDGLLPRRVRVPVVAPVEERVHDDGLRHVGGAVALVHDEVLLAEGVAEDAVVPVDLAVDRLRVGVDEELARVEPVAGGRLVGAVHAIAVALARADAGQVDVPGQRGVLHHRDALLLARLVEQAELDALGVLAEQREVRAATVPGRAEGSRIAGPGAPHWMSFEDRGGTCPPSGHVQ
jgi:hypothetical protein